MNSLYPVLVQSQASSRAAKAFGGRPGVMGASLPKFHVGNTSGVGVRLADLQPMAETSLPEAGAATEENLFEFIFEKRPFSSNAHYSLQVNIQPLTISKWYFLVSRILQISYFFRILPFIP